MKTIMIVPELPCKNCHKHEPNACVECFNINGKKEQVPESWEDLEKLVIDNCNNYTISFDGIKQRHSIECKGFIFYNFGLVEFSIATKTIDNDFVKFNRCLATEMQPKQMWQIIKNLIGEE